MEAPPALLWEPSPEYSRASAFAAYLKWLGKHRNLHFSGYWDTWEWSSSEIEEFWGSLWA